MYVIHGIDDKFGAVWVIALPAVHVSEDIAEIGGIGCLIRLELEEHGVVHFLLGRVEHYPVHLISRVLYQQAHVVLQ